MLRNSIAGFTALACVMLCGLLASTALTAQAAPERTQEVRPNSGQAPTLSAFEGSLAWVSADSGADAWAVGSETILHWNGRKWAETADPAHDADLTAVKAISPTDVWAVGSYCGALCGPGPQPNLNMLILHWNGKTWSKAGPIATINGSFLNGVTATSPTNAWAVGDYYSSTGAFVPVILHWNGKTWSKVPSPASVASDSAVHGVTATSTTNAWAVGSYNSKSGEDETLALHWNGKTWSKVSTPNFGVLNGVTATSATNAWAVGTYFTASNGTETLILHWNGKTWSKVTSPNPGGTCVSCGTTLSSVTATSPTNAWAVGYYDPRRSDVVPDSLILHWNGKTWSKVTSPHPGGTSGTSLTGVTATSGSSAWAVGNFATPSFNQYTLELHWNGKTWSRA
jgi:hypothetical protein